MAQDPMTIPMTRPSAVVITRPRAQAELLAPRVAALGLQPVLFPLLEIHPPEDSAALRAVLRTLRQYALVVFVSPNAIDAAFRHMDAGWPAEVAIGIVGAGSRAALAQHGVEAPDFHIVAPPNPEKTDSEGLLAALDLQTLQGRKVLIVRAQAGRDFLSDALHRAGVQVDHIGAYRRVAPTPDQAAIAQLRSLLDSNSCWIITSSEALRNLMQMLPQTTLDDAVVKMQQKRIIVPHPHIAQTARLAGFSCVTLTGSGDERLLAALQSDT
jgi:uroporphyrinogen-III synthase